MKYIFSFMQTQKLAGGLDQQCYNFKHTFSKVVMIYFEKIHTYVWRFFTKSFTQLTPSREDLACKDMIHKIYLFY